MLIATLTRVWNLLLRQQNQLLLVAVGHSLLLALLHPP